MTRVKFNPIASESKVYLDVNETRDSSWSDYANFAPKWNPPDNYFILSKVGRGKYSTVFKGYDKDKHKVAIKVLVPLDPKKYLREIKILENLKKSRNIVELVDLIHDEQTGIYSIILEWVEFLDWKKLYSEFKIDDVRYYMYQLLIAIDTAHKNGIMHRDVKPQNIAIDVNEKTLRLLDWGLADFYFRNKRYNSHVATRVFKPPEVLLNYPYYDYSMDIWSCGFTLGIMIFRKMVIEGAENDEAQLVKVAELVGGKNIIQYSESLRVPIKNEIKQQLLKATGTGWKPLIKKADPSMCPNEAIDLLDKMMCIDHRLRITAKGALNHQFFSPINKRQ